MLGLLIVQTTAIGCLYFLDPSNIANSKGLAAVGILLLVSNVAYVLVMLILIATFGASKTKDVTWAAFQRLKSTSAKLKLSLSHKSTDGSLSGPRDSAQDQFGVSDGVR